MAADVVAQLRCMAPLLQQLNAQTAALAAASAADRIEELKALIRDILALDGRPMDQPLRVRLQEAIGGREQPAKPSMAAASKMHIWYVAEVHGGDRDSIPVSMFGEPALFATKLQAEAFMAFANGTGQTHEVRQWAPLAHRPERTEDAEPSLPRP